MSLSNIRGLQMITYIILQRGKKKRYRTITKLSDSLEKYQEFTDKDCIYRLQSTVN